MRYLVGMHMSVWALVKQIVTITLHFCCFSYLWKGLQLDSSSFFPASQKMNLVLNGWLVWVKSTKPGCGVFTRAEKVWRNELWGLFGDRGSVILVLERAVNRPNAPPHIQWCFCENSKRRFYFKQEISLPAEANKRRGECLDVSKSF